MAANNNNNGLHFPAVVHDDDEFENSSVRKIQIQPAVSPSSIPEMHATGLHKKSQSPPKLSYLLGLHEIFTFEVWQAAVGELLGTAVLVFMLDTIVISTEESDVTMPNLIFSILAAVLITVLLVAVHPISGAHINPIVSFSAGLVGIVSLTRAAIYILAQCLGGVLGALALKAVVSSAIERKFLLGGCTVSVTVAGGEHGAAAAVVAAGLGTTQAFWMEAFCSFIFLFASIWIAYDHRQAMALGKLVVFTIIGVVLGLLVFVSTSVTGVKGYGGAGLNPARCLGPAIVRGGDLWKGHWVFWLGPAVACLAFYLYIKIIPKQHHKFNGYDHDICNVAKAVFGGGRL